MDVVLREEQPGGLVLLELDFHGNGTRQTAYLDAAGVGALRKALGDIERERKSQGWKKGSDG